MEPRYLQYRSFLLHNNVFIGLNGLGLKSKFETITIVLSAYVN